MATAVGWVVSQSAFTRRRNTGDGRESDPLLQPACGRAPSHDVHQSGQRRKGTLCTARVCGAQRQTGLAHGDGSQDGLMWGERGYWELLGTCTLTGWGSTGGCVCADSSYVVCPFPRVCDTSISENCHEAFNLDKRQAASGRGGSTQTHVWFKGPRHQRVFWIPASTDRKDSVRWTLPAGSVSLWGGGCFVTKGSRGGWWTAIQLHTCKEHVFSGDVIRQEKARKKTSNWTGVYNTDCRGPAPCVCRCGAELCQKGGWGVVGQSVASLSFRAAHGDWLHQEGGRLRGFMSLI